MPWVESVSPSFRARHESAQADDAQRLLHSLELTRERLTEYFPRAPGDFTVVLHRSALSLSMARPLLPLAWIGTAPAARRYVAGRAGGEELHVLTPEALEARASNVPGSREMLALTAAALYARQVIIENNRDLPRRLSPARIAAELRWAWLLEGAARWFSGQTENARPAIARRLHEGEAPSFPPGVRDALLLGGTVIDLLAREEGQRAAAQFACRLHPQGPRAALSRAFGGRPFVHTEGAWRSHLARLAATG
jgi:hypothetical protein